MIARLLRLEWAKWSTRREVRGGLIFLVGGVVAYGLLLRGLAESNLQLPALGGVEPSGFHVAYRALRAMLTPLGLLLLLWSAGSIAGEIETGTARAVLLRVPRASYALGKAVLLIAVVGSLLVTMLAAALVTGAAAFGLGAVRAGSVVLHGAGDLLLSGVLASLLTVPPLASLLAVGLCASCVARSQAAAQTLAIGAAFALWAASLVPALEPWTFVASVGTPLAVAVSHSEGLRTLSLSDDLLRHLGVNLLWTGGLLTAGIARLNRRDLP